MSLYASGKNALAICDRCGFSYDYLDIHAEWNGLRVCPDCWDEKHPQLESPKVTSDAIALRKPNPDRKEPLVMPVGEISFVPPFEIRRLNMISYVGRVTVSIT